MIYRDFIYMDTERIQSIIAQLEKGVLDKIMEGKTSELQGKASAAAGVLASFLPVGLEGGFTRKSDVQSSKVLHDYAFNIAFEALEKNELYIEVNDNWKRDEVPLPDAAFILVRGDVSILDYDLLKKLAENDFILSMLSGSSQTSQPQPSGKRRPAKKPHNITDPRMEAIKQIAELINTFMGDSIQIRLKYSDEISFAGLLSPQFLRENTYDFIFKYGGKPQNDWVILAQISQVTAPSHKLNALQKVNFPKFTPQEFSTFTDILNPIISILNMFQEAIASVSYPDIAVTPIAVFRELDRLR